MVDCLVFFFFFQAEDGIRDNWRDWSSDVCSSDLTKPRRFARCGLNDQAHELARGFVHAGALQYLSGVEIDPAWFLASQRGVGGYLECWHWERSEERRVGKECRARWWEDG